MTARAEEAAEGEAFQNFLDNISIFKLGRVKEAVVNGKEGRADLASLVLAEYQKKCGKWKADSKPQLVYTPDRLHLPALDSALIRKSSASSSAATYTTLDALHPRSFSLLTN